MNIFNLQKSGPKISDDFLEEKDWEGEEGFFQEKDTRLAEARFQFGRLRFLRVLVLVCFFVLAWRLFSLQILAGESYRQEAEGNRIRIFGISAPRGIIYDRDDNLLVRNIPSFQAVFVPADLPKAEEERIALIAELSEILDQDPSVIYEVFTSADQASREAEILMRNLARDRALILDTKLSSLPGINLLKVPTREYLGGDLLSHILGYTGKISPTEYQERKDKNYFLTDQIGKQGVESSYEEELRGKSGREIVEVDSRGRIEKILGLQSPQSGKSLKLALDLELQKKLYEEMMLALDQSDSEKGSAIALDPETGRILALVSIPVYNNNLFAQGISQSDFNKLTEDPNKPLFHRPLSGEYPPGSTIKPLIAVAALEENVIGPGSSFNCSGSLVYYGWAGTVWHFPDWKAHGPTNVRKAIAESCDVFFYIVGGGSEAHGISGLGIARIKDWARYFGLDSVLGVDLPGEASGLIPDLKWKQEVKGEDWYIGDTYHAAIGQGDILTTPLQITTYVASIANRGILYRPKIGYKIIDELTGMEREIKPEIIRRDFVEPGNLKIVRQGMREAVIYGSARGLASLPIEVAGKTGTAQFAAQGDRTHAWFTCFAPFERPEIVLTVLIEGGGDGDKVAVPVAENVLNWYFSEDND